MQKNFGMQIVGMQKSPGLQKLLFMTYAQKLLNLPKVPFSYFSATFLAEDHKKIQDNNLVTN